jgi:hypothetical protein
MRLGIAILLLACACALDAQVVVVNPQVQETALDAGRLADLLLGRVTTWADGTAVVLVLADDQEADAEVVKLTGRTRERLLRGWKRLVFSGTGVMPVEATSAAAALELVARTPGALAVLAKADATTRWRVLTVSPGTPPPRK